MAGYFVFSAMLTGYFVFSAILLSVASGAANVFTDVREGYVFMFHDDHDLILVTKDNECYYVSISQLAARSLLHASPASTEGAVLAILQGTVPADVRPAHSSDLHTKYEDQMADILCQGRLLYDVTLDPFTATTTTTTTTTTTANGPDEGYDCDFEHGLCSWTNVQGDDSDWTRGRGSNSVSAAAPTVDHSMGTEDGTYLYVNTPAAAAAATTTTTLHTATLQSKQLPAPSDYCVRFWHYIRGPGVNGISVYMKSERHRSQEWSLSVGNQTQDRWGHKRLYLDPSSFPFVLQIEANFDLLQQLPVESNDSVIAIDDIIVRRGLCH